MADTRREKDPLGPLDVPMDAQYGVQTLRAKQNFPISGLRPLDAFVDAQVWIKKAAALTHKETGRLDREARRRHRRRPPTRCSRGQHRDQFVVDPYQAGAGTSHNMNVNEVLANRANELLGGKRGEYTPVHPNDHVNMAQSHERHDPDQHPAGVSVAARRRSTPRSTTARRPRREGTRVRRHREGRAHAPAGRDADPARPGVHGIRGVASREACSA